jgi:NAD(P)-dependent dehydrogenase (short-subunit alcohol dehydrogenase family)
MAVAFITGGSRGIGLGISEHLAKKGFDLAINGMRNADSVADVIDHLKSYGVDVIYCQGNVASREDRAAMLSQIKNHYGRLDVLVNNAGVAPKVRNDVLATTEESYDYVLDTNLKANYFLTQSVANWMIQQKEKYADFQGSIINISSISATVASVNRGEYCVSKAGIAMNTQLFAARLGEYGINVYEVRPGVIKTDMTATVTEKYDNLIENGLTVQKRWGYPDDIGRAVAALAIGDFPYSTGSVFMIDGGLTIPRL